VVIASATNISTGSKWNWIEMELGKRGRTKSCHVQPIREEHGVQQTALGDGRGGDDVLQADRIVGGEIVRFPARLVVAVRRHEDDEMGLALRGHGRLRGLAAHAAGRERGSTGCDENQAAVSRWTSIA
jgi:hypothetical protein